MVDAQASAIPKTHARGQDVTPPKKDTPAQGAFTFGTATMKMMAVVYRLIVPVAFIFVALLSIGDWWQLPVAIGLALIALLERFDEFNRNLPSALGSLAVRSAGFVADSPRARLGLVTRDRACGTRAEEQFPGQLA